MTALPAPLHPDAAPADACDGLAWATLLVRSGEALERLRARRALAAGDDEAAALKKKEELVDQLRAKDPGAEVDVTQDGRGKYVLHKISFHGHLFECPVVVNPFSDVSEIVKGLGSRRCSKCMWAYGRWRDPDPGFCLDSLLSAWASPRTPPIACRTLADYLASWKVQCRPCTPRVCLR